jgi:hypothetical protein
MAESAQCTAMHDVDDLSSHLARITRLDPIEARRAVVELLDLLSAETAEAYVVRRHRELQASGALKNDAIFRLIADELVGRPFAAPAYSERQIRRLIYG